MKYLAIITLAITCMSCVKLTETELVLKHYIEDNSDISRSYESVEISSPTEEDLINILNLRAQFANVESVIFRIHRITKSLKSEFGEILPETLLSKIDTILSMYNGDDELRFSNIDSFSSETLKLPLYDQVKVLVLTDSEKKQRLVAQSTMFESAADRLKVETDGLFTQVKSRLHLSPDVSISDIPENIEEGNIIIHKYRIKQYGAPVLKSALFIFNTGVIVGSVPVEIPENK